MYKGKHSSEHYEQSKGHGSHTSHDGGEASAPWHDRECASDSEELRGYSKGHEAETHGTEE